MNRTTPPPIATPKQINIPAPIEHTFSNGNRLAVINAGTQDVTKVELILHAGTRYQEKLLVARSATALLSDGSRTMTSQQIAEKLDYMGSFMEVNVGHDYTTIALLSTNRHLDQSLGILADTLHNPTYPQHELDVYCRKGKQALLVEQEKVSTLARKQLLQTVFGSNHPYGMFAEATDFDKLSRNDLIKFHTSNLIGKNCFITLSGKISDTEMRLVEKHLNNTIADRNLESINKLPPIAPPVRNRVFSPKSEAVQNAIRMGMVTIPRYHPDSPALMVLNTILGGYFGSRLMQNIREDKGYTYSISSLLVPYRETCLWTIGTQVGSENTQSTIDEIHKEIATLRNEEVSADELNLVKGFLMGEVLRTFDGPFAISESIASIYEYNDNNFDYFTRIIETINTINSKNIVETAQKYFDTENMVESIAGQAII